MLTISPKYLLDLLTPEWKKELNKEFSKDYFKKIAKAVDNHHQKNLLCPKIENVFRALNLVSIDKTKVVIIGQDPYHGLNQANGLAFAVNKEIKTPPSLKNIFKEIETDIQKPLSTEKSLLSWANQGVLLLNNSLTVKEKNANSHKEIGWDIFTNKILDLISSKRENIVFILWGNFALKKEKLINKEKHLILKSPHPSPLSAYKGFFGCKHFSKANKYLEKHNKTKVNWTI